MANKNLYEQLEVSPSTSAAEIKDAHKRQAMKYHPDRNFGNRAEAELNQRDNKGYFSAQNSRT